MPCNIDYEVYMLNMYNIDNSVPAKIYMLLSFINVTIASLLELISLNLKLNMV